MKSNKEIRKRAWETVKKNYFVLVFVCIVMMVIAGSYVTTMSGVKNIIRKDFSINFNREYDPNIRVNYLTDSNLDITNDVLHSIFGAETEEDIYFSESVTGGLYRTVFDGVTHAERFIFKTVKYVLDFFVEHNHRGIVVITIIILQLLYMIFIQGPLKVSEARVFMESRIYCKTPFKRMIDILTKNKSYLKIVKTIFLRELYQLLWNFTIVGGIIKVYSYRLVTMIVAENPSIGAKETISLSRKMMNGNKWKLFKLDFSFLWMQILDIFSFGTVGVFFINPLYRASMVEFYTEVKELYIDEKKEGYENLNDKALLENPDNNECYPGVKRKELKRVDEIFHYYQKYTLSSMILMFFFFSFLGWLWEVGIYIYKTGSFVNRGTFTGPLLPIYGSGCMVILMLLFLPKKFKKVTDKPLLTFGIAMLLCGVIEYATSWYLEMVHGMRWWDYTGYFLNINGRVCFEGLTFFGIGGCLCLYIAAPYLHALITKMSHKLRIILCVILVIAFFVDFIYSSIHPNIGAGITDDNVQNVIQESQHINE